MIIKFIEIRDHGTCVPAIAIQMASGDPIGDRFLWRCGYPRFMPASVVLMRLVDQRAASDPYDWGDRTHTAAHVYIGDHFEELANGQVVDVRVVLGETTEPAAPEIAP